jgi:hypothetical protein
MRSDGPDFQHMDEQQTIAVAGVALVNIFLFHVMQCR